MCTTSLGLPTSPYTYLVSAKSARKEKIGYNLFQKLNPINLLPTGLLYLYPSHIQTQTPIPTQTSARKKQKAATATAMNDIYIYNETLMQEKKKYHQSIKYQQRYLP